VFERFADKLLVNQQIDPEDRELYIYGLREGLFIVLNILITLIIGLLMGMIWQSIVFMTVYSPLRMYAGGVHAKTHIRCFFYSILLTVITLLTIKFVPDNTIIILTSALISGVIIFFLSPVEDKNKPLDRLERANYKKRSRIILGIIMIIMGLLVALSINTIALCISVSLAALSIMLVLGVLKNGVAKRQ